MEIRDTSDFSSLHAQKRGAVNFCNRQFFIFVFSIAVLALSSVALYLPLFQSSMSWIDDHEYASFLNDGGHLRLSEIFTVLGDKTELGNFPDSLRYRPFYYLLRVLLTFFFGLDGEPRFALRILVCFVTILALAASSTFVLARSRKVRQISYSHTFLFFVIAFCLLTRASWSDITTRLGPSELELIWGFSIFLLCFTKILISDLPPTSLNFFGLLSGLFIAVGSKENGLVLLVPLLFILVSRGFPSRRVVIWKFATSIVMLFSVAIGIIIIRGMRLSGSDVYGNRRTVKTVFFDLGSALEVATIRYILIALIVLFFFSLWHDQTNQLCFVSLLLITSISDLVFYQGDVSQTHRFAALTQVCLIMAYGVVAVTITDFVNERSSRRMTIQVWVSLIAIGALVFLFGTVASGWTAIRVAAESRQTTSLIWKANVTEIQESSRTLNSSQFLIVAEGYEQYELSASIGSFVRVLVPGSLTFLTVTTEDTPNDFQQTLLSTMQTISVSGNASWHILPLSDLDQKRKTTCLIVGAAPTFPSFCSKLVRID